MRNLILVVDDLRYFGEDFEDLRIVYARTAYDANKFIESNWNRIAEIWLDHDLGYDKERGRFADVDWVLDFIDEKLFMDGYTPGYRVIRILTSNPVGAKKIETWMSRFNFKLNRHIPVLKGMIDDTDGTLLTYE